MNKKGFTLAELLIVVAIIGVLVAIVIPIFLGQIEKAKEASDAANIRGEYAKLMADVVSGEDTNKEYKVSLVQQYDGWQNTFDFPCAEIGTPKKGGSASLEFKDDTAYINYGDGGSVTPGNSFADKASAFVVSNNKQTTVVGTLYKYKDEYYIATKNGNLDPNEEPADNSKGLYKVNINTVFNVSDINSESELKALKNVKKGDVLYDTTSKKYYVYYGTNQTLKPNNDLQIIN